MLVLCLDNPHHHMRDYGTRTPRTVHVGIKDATDALGLEFKLALDASAAEGVLCSQKVDLVVIHHYGYVDVDILKRKHPEVKFAAVGGSILDAESARPGSVAEAYRQAILTHYDLIVDQFYEGIGQALGIGTE